MRFMLVMAAALALAGCSMGKDMSATDAAVDDFHSKLNTGDYAGITNAAGPELKNSGTDFNGILARVHALMGPLKSSQRQSVNDNINNGDHTFTATYASVFVNGKGTEEFVYRLNSGAPVVIGYHIKSPTLMGPDPAPSASPGPQEESTAPEDRASPGDATPTDDSKPAGVSGGH